ncbi:hypothetical protein TNCV_1072051 [Trichonephila clavipes]|nr:hypothetical protein TNCV_1072051 [Trichonephila clavipes]
MFLAGHPSQRCFGLQSHCAPCYYFNQASFYASDFSFTRIPKKYVDSFSLNEDALDEFGIIYDNKEVPNDEGAAQLLRPD